jgi:prepilin signal peptidase PulO-like enzyme (type II secretory pathway)
MQNFFYSYFILFLIATGAIGFLAGMLIHQFTSLIPGKLEKNWKTQAWQYLYPNHEIPSEIIKAKTITTHKKYSWRLACLTAFFSTLIVYYFGPNWTTIANLVLMWGLLLLACIDFKYCLLPDCLTLPLLWLGLLCNTFGLFTPMQEAIWGAIIGYTSLWLIATIFKYCRHKEGLGQGDFKLLAAFGAWWGVCPLFFIVMIASFVGAAVGLIQIARGSHSLEKPMPFGPYLIFAAFIVMFFGDFFLYSLTRHCERFV